MLEVVVAGTGVYLVTVGIRHGLSRLAEYFLEKSI